MEQVNLAEAARRVGLSPQRIRQLATEDAHFPERQWVGNAWIVAWPEFKRWNDARQPKPGRPRKRADAKRTDPGTATSKTDGRRRNRPPGAL